MTGLSSPKAHGLSYASSEFIPIQIDGIWYNDNTEMFAAIIERDTECIFNPSASNGLARNGQAPNVGNCRSMLWHIIKFVLVRFCIVCSGAMSEEYKQNAKQK
jgi:hypothetical protein